MSLSIRPARRGDVLAVAAIERHAFTDPWPPIAFADYVDREVETFFVAEDALGVVGYAIIRGAAGQGELLNLAVRPDARGRGIGGTLLDAMLAAAWEDGIRELTLEVRQSNAPALALYTSRGFAPVGVRRGYYTRPREDAVVMRVELAAEAWA